MHVGTYIRSKQPDIFNKLYKSNKRNPRRGIKEHLSFNYIKNELMTHDSYIRHRGALAQRRWGK